MHTTHTDQATGIIVKSDRSGRTRYTDEFKQEVLSAFESSSLSGPAFAVSAQSLGVGSCWPPGHR